MVEYEEHSLVVCKRITFQPGDATKYEIVVVQTPLQNSVNEVSIALLDMRGHGAAFSYSGDAIKWAWCKMQDLPMDQQLDEPEVQFMAGGPLKHVNNPWTARAIIEVVCRVMKWDGE